MKRLAGSLLAFALAASSVLPPPVLFHCPVTGKKNQPACCCAPRASQRSACCGAARATPCSAAGLDAAPRDRTARAVVRGICCSVTREPREARLLARDTLDASWRSLLDGARASGLAIAATLPESSCSPRPHALYRPPATPRERAGPLLFILHRALLI
jgi:hypothetical protein